MKICKRFKRGNNEVVYLPKVLNSSKRNGKFIIALIIMLFSVTGLMAEGPKISMEFKQLVDACWIETSSSPVTIGTHAKDSIFARTESKANITLFDTKIYMMTPWIMDRLEWRLNPGTLPGGGTDTRLGEIGVRNRLYIGIDNKLVIAEFLNILINFELRTASYLKTDSMATNADSPVPIEVRVTPILGFSGKYKGFSYIVVQRLNYYTDQDNTSASSDFFELEGTYQVAYSFPISKDFKFNLCAKDALIITFNDKDHNSFHTVKKAENEVYLKGTLCYGGFTHFAGLWIYTKDSNPNSTAEDITGIGLTCGVGFKKNTWGINLIYKGAADVNPEKSNHKWQNTATVCLSMKI